MRGVWDRPGPPDGESVPAGVLLRGRQQGYAVVRRRGRGGEVPLREGRQDPALLRDGELLGNPEEEDQDQVRPLRATARVRLRRRPSDDRQPRSVPLRTQSGHPQGSSLQVQDQGPSNHLRNLTFFPFFF